MSLIELFVIAVGLSMDAFALSICKGLSLPGLSLGNTMIVGLYFGSFQALMPFLGYLLGYQFRSTIIFIDHWIAWILLSIIGFNMIRESFSKEEAPCSCSLDMKNMLMLAIATSIDALAVGVTFAFLDVSILPAILFIGVTTFLISSGGVSIGHVFGIRFKAKSEFLGGLILVLMGLKILVEHTLLS